MSETYYWLNRKGQMYTHEPRLLTWIKLLIPGWIGDHMCSKVWDEITYGFLNFNGCTDVLNILKGFTKD